MAVMTKQAFHPAAPGPACPEALCGQARTLASLSGRQRKHSALSLPRGPLPLGPIACLITRATTKVFPLSPRCSVPAAQRPSVAGVEHLPCCCRDEASILPGCSRCPLSAAFLQDWGTPSGLRGLGAAICDGVLVNLHIHSLLDRIKISVKKFFF